VNKFTHATFDFLGEFVHHDDKWASPHLLVEAPAVTELIASQRHPTNQLTALSMFGFKRAGHAGFH
jgi:hypothetical protein